MTLTPEPIDLETADPKVLEEAKTVISIHGKLPTEVALKVAHAVEEVMRKTDAQRIMLSESDDAERNRRP